MYLKQKAAPLLFALPVLAGCIGQVESVTTTPLPTETPDLSATAAIESFIARQTAVAEAQATLDAAQNEVATERTALADEQTALSATQTAVAEAQTTIDAQRAALEADQEEAAVVIVTNEAVAAANDTAAAANEAAAATNVAVASELQATSEALAALATALYAPTATPQEALAPAAGLWQQVEVSQLRLLLVIPPGFEKIQDEPGVVFAIVDDTSWSPTIVLDRQNIETMFSAVQLVASDPVSGLAALLSDPGVSSLYEILEEPVPYEAPFPAAQARLTVPEPGMEMVTALFKITEDDWLSAMIFGSPEQLAQWTDPVLQSITLTGIEAVTGLDTPQQSGEEVARAAMEAVGVTFAVPEGWSISTGDNPSFERATVQISLPGRERNRRIALVRGSSAEFAAESGFPEYPEDALDALSQFVDAMLAESNMADYSGGRYNEVAIGEFIGAWTQIRNDTETIRMYLFPGGADDWLFIGALGNRDTFNDFSRTELRAFLNSMQLQPDEGVALGLDFVIPESWVLDQEDRFAVSIHPPYEDNPNNRYVAFARGGAEQFADMRFPVDVTDSRDALQAVAEHVVTTGDYGRRIRVEPVQINDLSGAIVNLRGDETASRLYLFRLGDDDWLMIVASANRDDFNTFNRSELRDIIGSLMLVAGGDALSVTPIGPIEEAVVTHISDGDTIYVMLNGLEESVRIIGVDTPEAHHPTGGADWMGYTATHYMETLISVGDTVYLESDIKDRDDFQRLLRYVWTRDDAGNWSMVEAELIRAGMAHVRTYDEDRYVPYFMALEREASSARRGIWGDPPPAPPTEPIAADQQRVWAANPDGDFMPMLYDAAALGNVPDPYGYWPSYLPAVVEDAYYVYPTDIDPLTGQPVAEDKVGYWYWLEINDFRGWVPESWLLLEAPAYPASPPDTDIIAYGVPFVVADAPLQAMTMPGSGEITGEFEPEVQIQVEKLAMDPATGEWWLYADTQTVDGWVPLKNLNRLSPENR